VKRIITLILTLVVVAGAAFTAQLWIDRSPLGATFGTESRGAFQIGYFPLSEPASIVLSSIVLLASTTVLRRRHTQRRQVMEVKEPKWRFLPGNGRDIKEVI
jgi:hypothetical protein